MEEGRRKMEAKEDKLGSRRSSLGGVGFLRPSYYVPVRRKKEKDNLSQSAQRTQRF